MSTKEVAVKELLSEYFSDQQDLKSAKHAYLVLLIEDIQRITQQLENLEASLSSTLGSGDRPTSSL